MPDSKATRPDTGAVATEKSALSALALPRKLTQFGMFAERLFRAFWPLWTVFAVSLAALVFLAPLGLPLEAIWILGALFLLAFVAAGVWGARRFRLPPRDVG